MGSVVISGATSGAITLAVPAEAGTRTLTLPAETGTVLTNSTTGCVLQVVTANFTGIQTIAAAASNVFNFVDITSLSVAITPKTTSSKILLMAQVNIGCNTADRMAALRFTGGNADDFVGDTASNRQRVAGILTSPSGAGAVANMMSITYLDSPATTSAVTYKVQGAPNYGSGTVAINYKGTDNDAAYYPRGACSLTAMEIA
jgi:hypothetical protein